MSYSLFLLDVNVKWMNTFNRHRLSFMEKQKSDGKGNFRNNEMLNKKKGKGRKEGKTRKFREI